MTLHLNAQDALTIDGISYRVAEHPAAPGMAYGQEGRQAIVYQLMPEMSRDGGERCALKVFKAVYRTPGLASMAERLRPLANLPGLAVCRRTVLTPQCEPELLRQNSDLTYAVLMPWIEGPTWMQVMLEQRDLMPAECLALARGLADVLARMEQETLAHCDLSGPNVLLPGVRPSPPAPLPDAGEGRRPSPTLPLLGAGEGVALVDVEQMYGTELRRPATLPGGSPGYAHRTAPEGLWAAETDRFAGAVLLAEMLGWCDERVRAASWGESYFEPREMQQESSRYQALLAALRERWGDRVAGLFERAWRSERLVECATFGEWLAVLPERVATAAEVSEPRAAPEALTTTARDAAAELVEHGRRLEIEGDLPGARSAYERAQALAGSDSALGQELALMVGRLDERVQVRAPVGEPASQRRPAAPQASVQKPPTETAKPLTPRRRRVRLWGCLAGLLLATVVAGGSLICLAAGGISALWGPRPTATLALVRDLTPTFRSSPTADRTVTATPVPASTPTVTLAPTRTAAAAPSEVPTSGASAPLSSTREIFARRGWQDTGVQLRSGDRVLIEYVSGAWTFWKGSVDPSDAGGPMDQGTFDDFVPGARKGELIGRVGAQGLAVGNRLAFVAQAAGSLELRINDADCCLDDNEGSIIVRITVQRPSASVVSVTAKAGWQDTGIPAQTGDRVVVEYVSGQWTDWAGHDAPS